MKTRTLATLALVGGALASASAQTNGPTGFSARLGLFVSTGDIFDTSFAGGIDYKISSFNVRAPGEGLQSYLGVSADYYGNGDASNIPVALTYNVRSGALVYSAGIGVDFYNIDKLDDGASTSLGGQVGIAYEFGNAGRVDKPLFVAAKYFITRKSDLGGFGLYVGYRF